MDTEFLDEVREASQDRVKWVRVCVRESMAFGRVGIPKAVRNCPILLGESYEIAMPLMCITSYVNQKGLLIAPGLRALLDRALGPPYGF